MQNVYLCIGNEGQVELKSPNAQTHNGVYPHIAPTMLLADGVNSAAAQPAIQYEYILPLQELNI